MQAILNGTETPNAAIVTKVEIAWLSAADANEAAAVSAGRTVTLTALQDIANFLQATVGGVAANAGGYTLTSSYLLTGVIYTPSVRITDSAYGVGAWVRRATTMFSDFFTGSAGIAPSSLWTVAGYGPVVGSTTLTGGGALSIVISSTSAGTVAGKGVISGSIPLIANKTTVVKNVSGTIASGFAPNPGDWTTDVILICNASNAPSPGNPFAANYLVIRRDYRSATNGLVLASANNSGAFTVNNVIIADGSSVPISYSVKAILTSGSGISVYIYNNGGAVVASGSYTHTATLGSDICVGTFANIKVGGDLELVITNFTQV